MRGISGTIVEEKPRSLYDLRQVLRDEIGTAMTNIKSRTDHTYMVRKGRGRPRRDSSRKRVQMYVWHRLCVTLTLRMPDATKLVAVSFRLSEKLTLRILIATKVVAEWRIDPSNICCYQSGSTLSVQELEPPISSATTLVANEIRGVNFSLNRNACATNLVAICIRGVNFWPHWATKKSPDGTPLGKMV